MGGSIAKALDCCDVPMQAIKHTLWDNNLSPNWMPYVDGHTSEDTKTLVQGRMDGTRSGCG